ncbi:MAG TPA: DNA polymerase III subunit chi [Caulobacteraceae bacterium]|nr:DNA polymerase III subunit chi [Caulobacteraceae bacterium]
MTDTPCEVWFYHLERTVLDQALPELLEKTIARGWRALVRTGDLDRVEHLDGWLWSYRDESFLAHGTDAEPMAERQPILLTTGEANLNDAQALFLVDGAEAGPLDGYERCILLFDGRDADAVSAARDRWRAFRQAGHPVSYWRQGAERGWERDA